MLLCPRCVDALTETQVGEVTEFACLACGGRAETVPVLRRAQAADTLESLWSAARATAGPDGLRCPSCSDGMGRAELVVEGDRGEVPACGRCQVVWFDGAGATALPPSGTDGPKAPPISAPPPPRAATAPPARTTAPVGRKPLKAKRMDADTVEMDLEGKGILGAAMGLIAKVNAPERLVRPWITWTVAASFLALVVLPAIGDWTSSGFHAIGETRSAWAQNWGLVPAELFRHGGLTFLTSFFLHGGLWHAFANGYFLVLTGEDLEGKLGRLRFVGLLLASSVLGDLLDAATRMDRSIPSIGASGGVSGLLAYYALAFPQVKAGIPFVWWSMHTREIHAFQWRIPVRWLLWFWIGSQILLASRGDSGIAYAAHLGGALAGGVWWLVERNRAATAAAAAATPPR